MALHRPPPWDGRRPSQDKATLGDGISRGGKSFLCASGVGRTVGAGPSSA